MTFRRPLSQKWFYPFILCAGVTVCYVAVIAGTRMSNEGFFEAALLSLLGVGLGVVFSWNVWTARIDVDDRGVRWREGKDRGDLLWEEISGLAQDGVSLGLIERSSARVITLPFVTRPIYKLIVGRLKPLKPEEERILFAELPEGD